MRWLILTLSLVHVPFSFAHTTANLKCEDAMFIQNFELDYANKKIMHTTSSPILNPDKNRMEVFEELILLDWDEPLLWTVSIAEKVSGRMRTSTLRTFDLSRLVMVQESLGLSTKVDLQKYYRRSPDDVLSLDTPPQVYTCKFEGGISEWLHSKFYH